MPKHREAPSTVGVMHIECKGFEAVEKIARKCSTSGRVLVPKQWIGKKILVIRIEP
jgi:hypothetical protein